MLQIYLKLYSAISAVYVTRQCFARPFPRHARIGLNNIQCHGTTKHVAGTTVDHSMQLTFPTNSHAVSFPGPKNA